ncbi:endonuclease III [Desulfovibrio sp. OttesenSCG-928-A18]|nr:endonuclease III [Desulfovibrio sp. OttesenSCG-928-A18]
MKKTDKIDKKQGKGDAPGDLDGKGRAQKKQRAAKGAFKAPGRAGPENTAAPGPEQRETAARVLSLLKIRYPAPQTHLRARNPWELLAATMLAAQCTDARVNMVTPALFARWPDPAAMAGAEPAAVEVYVRSTGFFRNKAKNLVGAARKIMESYDGRVPSSMAELLTLPGVARKTANVVLFGAFGINEGLAVDTHVGRIAHRLGLTSGRDPLRSEKELMKLFPREEWGDINHRLVWFGREVCSARSPACQRCEMAQFCPKNEM